jgi:hypothetical protein
MLHSPEKMVFKMAAKPMRVLIGIFLVTFLIYGYFSYVDSHHPFPRPLRGLGYASAAEKAKIKNDIAVVILTASPTIDARLGNLMSSWVPNWAENTYWFSDNDVLTVKEFPKSMRNNWVFTGCDKQYTSGLLCKNKKMISFFQQPENRHYKWVMRLMDDTYLHIENLAELVGRYNESLPIVIGEKYCHPSFSYPTGGPGFVISRGLIDSFDFQNWQTLTSRHNIKESLYDDLVWGQQLIHMKALLMHHHGFSQLSASKANPMFNYLISRETWNLPFRPIAYHQGPNKFDIMPHLEDILHRLPYDNLDSRMIGAPDCQCWPMQPSDHEIRCTATEQQRARDVCGDGLKTINCLTGA